MTSNIIDRRWVSLRKHLLVLGHVSLNTDNHGVNGLFQGTVVLTVLRCEYTDHGRDAGDYFFVFSLTPM